MLNIYVNFCICLSVSLSPPHPSGFLIVWPISTNFYRWDNVRKVMKVRHILRKSKTEEKAPINEGKTTI